MSRLINERMSAEVEGGVVLFLIGMRLNRPWKLWQWLPIMAAMVRMLNELGRKPDLGLLSARTHFGLRNVVVVQYWRSVEALLAFAHDPQRTHLPAWLAFNRAVGTGGDVGIWHETYVAPPGQSESIYANMPRYGLGLAGTLHPSKGERASAGKRLGLK